MVGVVKDVRLHFYSPSKSHFAKHGIHGEKGVTLVMGVDRQGRIRIAGHTILVLAENQLGGAARDHVGRRVCPRSRNDPWHHRGIRHP
jgi:hypothetical protein